MKIFHITGYYPPHLGGMEYRIKELSEMSAKRGHEVEIITSDIGACGRKLPSQKNLRIHYLKSVEFAHTPISPALFFALWRIPKHSAVHLHIAHALIPEITYLVCTIRRIPYMATIHLDVSSSGFFGFLLPLYKRFFLARVIRNAGAITVLTKDYKTLIRKKYGVAAGKIVIVPNGTHFETTAHRRTTLHTPIRLLFVGRLSVQKNIPLLIKAFHLCMYRYTLPMHLQIAGTGEKEREIRTLIRHMRLEKYVTMLGEVSAYEAQKLYHNSDIFILPSRAESFGTVLIEAMASGTPVIATNIPGVKNVIIDKYNGLLVNQNPKDTARAIRTLVKNSTLRKTLIRNGLEAVKKYNWENVTDQFEDIYRSILLKIIK